MRSIVEEALTKARDETPSVSQNNEDLDQILAEDAVAGDRIPSPA